MNFTETQNTLLVISSFFFLISLHLHIKKKNDFIVMFFLALTAISVFSFSALLDPFLNLWDERFHALVAKNLLHHPLQPTLYDDPVLSIAYDRWDRYHIWLHKQPLFLWQIALSFKLFGVSEFTLRLPNIVLGTVLVLVSYRSGKLLFSNRVGYIAAVMMVSSFYLLELIGGRQELDHNDVSFLAYVSLSIWSFIEYYYSKKKFWICLIGIFSGMAILCKWLVGLLVFLGWIALKIQEKKLTFSKNKDLLVALFVTILVALPWQVLTFIWYPKEAIAAQKYNSLHFTEPLDGHGGDFWYHFEKFGELFGALSPFFILLSFFIAYKSFRHKKMFFSLIVMLSGTYLFYSLAATKMPSFTIITAMITFIFLAFLMDCLIRHIKNRSIQNVALVFVTFILIIVRIDLKLLKERHSKHHTKMMIANKEIFSSLRLPENTVLFNVKGRHYIESMFYTGLPSYNFIPTEEQYLELKNKDRAIAVFHNHSEAPLPEYLNDTTITILSKELQGYE